MTGTESYVLACVKTGTIQGFDADGEPVFESKPRLAHYSTTNGEWLFLLIVAAKRAGIERVEFMRGGVLAEVVSVDALVSRFKRAVAS